MGTGSASGSSTSAAYWLPETLTPTLMFPRTPNKTEDPNGFYSTDCYTDRLIQFFEERSNDEKEKAFFAFLPYTAPHWPLQCSKAQRDKWALPSRCPIIPLFFLPMELSEPCSIQVQRRIRRWAVRAAGAPADESG